MSDGGKGSKQRPTNLDAYYFNYDLLFGKKKARDPEHEAFEKWEAEQYFYTKITCWTAWLGALKSKGVLEAENTRPVFDEWLENNHYNEDLEYYDAWYSAVTWLQYHIENSSV